MPWERKSLYVYLLKANPFLTEVMAGCTDRIEVCSMGEFLICRELEIPPEKLLISGVLKKKEDIYRILDACEGRCRYTVESIKQLIISWSGAMNIRKCSGSIHG